MIRLANINNVDINNLTPIEKINNVYIKREDKFIINDVCGGKTRSAYELIINGIEQGYTNFVTAGSRQSPQCEIVSYLCEYLNVKAHLFMPKGKDTSVIKNINNNSNSTIHRTKVGYNSVICKWSNDYAIENNFYYIPFGMECEENIKVTQHQVKNIPNDIKRIIMPIGSGMSFVSVLNGLELYQKYNINVVGIQIGKDVQKTLKKYLNAPHIHYEIINSELKYAQIPKNTTIGNIELDPTYESKCIPYLKDNDLFWIVGKRND